jgi:hypothetical protein
MRSVYSAPLLSVSAMCTPSGVLPVKRSSLMWARIPAKGEKIGEEGVGLNGDLADLRSEALLWQDTQSAR